MASRSYAAWWGSWLRSSGVGTSECEEIARMLNPPALLFAGDSLCTDMLFCKSLISRCRYAGGLQERSC